MEYRGMCDASAAVEVGAELFVVANDEDNRLRLYRRGSPQALQEFDVSGFLEAGADEEVDLEGATRAPNGLIYWITSHGANKNGKARPARRRLFATQIVHDQGSVTLKTMHHPYSGLVEDLVREPKLAKYGFEKAARLAPEATGGLNIEGLASTPDGRLLIGFRNPLSGGRALVVTLDNPDAVLDGSGKASFGDAIELDLGGSGVRSLEYVEAKAAYLIVAGPTGDEGAFKLFLWNGPGAVGVTEIRNAPVQDLQPEAVVTLPSSKEILLISDDGGRAMGGRRCKDLTPAQQLFRTRAFTLP
ncbi:hypothetical protein SR39_24070 [Methylobacterium radiotolerans]|nr:hypothetical protein SR39_24070 [Methylobacterium radiotolerans]